VTAKSSSRRPRETNGGTETRAPAEARPRHRVRLPGFLIEEEVGLGDVIKKATSSAGIKPCGSCQKRAAALNRFMSFR
jgi:hypothetical protein